MNEKKKVTKKRLIFVVVVLLLLLTAIILIGYFFSQPSKGVLTEGDESRVAMSGTNRLRDDVPNGITQQEGRVVTKCFSYQYSVQYNPRNEESESSCAVRSSLFNPKGLLTVSWKQFHDGQTFLDDTGLNLRLKQPEIFTPISIVEEKFSSLQAFSAKQETVEVTVFADVSDGILVVSLHDFIGSEEEATAIVKNVLHSVELP